MLLTKKTAADKLAEYFRHQLTLAQLVDWAEHAMMEGEFAESDAAVLRNVIGRLAVADVRTFGLSWEECQQLLGELGYSARVDVVAA